MKWFGKGLLCASLGSFGAAATAQETQWQPLAISPSAVRPVSLGRPTPLPAPGQTGQVRGAAAFVPVQTPPAGVPIRTVGVFVPVQQPSASWGAPPANRQSPPPSVIRAAMPPLGEAPKFLPRDLGSPDADAKKDGVRSLHSFQSTPNDQPKIIVIDSAARTTPGLIFPGIPDGFVDGQAIYVDEHGHCRFDEGGEQPARFYASAEWLRWWTRGFHLPPLVTTASPFDPEDTRGALGFGTTQLIFGNSTTSTGPTSGARFIVGYVPDPCGCWAVEGSFFFLGQKNDNTTFDSTAFPVLARPFFNINDGKQDRELVTSPGLLQTNLQRDLFKAVGAFQVNTSSSLLGAEANVRSFLWGGCDFCVTGIVGVRYLQLNEHLGLREQAVIQRDVPPVPGFVGFNTGDLVTVTDSFGTRNRFYGGQIGANAEWRSGSWTLETRCKLALGATHQSVDIDGSQRVVTPGVREVSFPGGLYALPSNSGHRSQSRFGVVPEVGVRLGFDVTDNIRIFAGYDFLYWSSVLRPGDQIDPALDVNQVPNSGGSANAANQVRPVVPFRTSSFWAHGVNAGLEFRY